MRSIQCRVERSYKCQLFLAIPVLDPFSQRGHLAGPQIAGHGFPGENEEKPRSLKESDSHPQGFCKEPWLKLQQFQKGSSLLQRNTAASCPVRNLHKGLLAQPFPNQREEGTDTWAACRDNQSKKHSVMRNPKNKPYVGLSLLETQNS